MRRKMRRAMMMASTMVPRPGSVSTMSADARACRPHNTLASSTLLTHTCCASLCASTCAHGPARQRMFCMQAVALQGLCCLDTAERGTPAGKLSAKVSTPLKIS